MKIATDILKSKKILVLTDQLMYSGLNFVTTLCLDRILTASGFGIYSMVVLSIYLVISIGNAFIIQPFQVANKAFKTSKDYSNFLFSSQIAFVVLALITAYVLNLYIAVPSYHFIPLAFMIAGIVLHDYFRKYYLALSEVAMVLMIDLIVSVSQIAAMAYLFYTGDSTLDRVFLVIGLSYALGVVFSLYTVKPRFQNLVYWSSFLKYHKKEGKWLGLVSFVQWGSANLFIVTLGVFISIEALGAFRLVQSMFGVLNVLFQTFENYVLPNASLIYADSPSRSKIYIKKVSLQSSLLIGLVLFTLFLFSKDLMQLAAGNRYAEYSYVIKGMCVLYFILFIGYPVRLSIRMLLMNKSLFIGYMLSFAFSILFFNYLLKHWQLNGVILGLILNQIIMLLFWNYQLNLKKFHLWK